ncbi:hypothetical protein R6Q59_006442 [Mikania micrantha]
MNLLTAENLEALLERVKRSPPLNTAADLIPRKRRRRDPRPEIVVREPETEIIPEIQVPIITVQPTEPVLQSTESTAGPSSIPILKM